MAAARRRQGQQLYAWLSRTRKPKAPRLLPLAAARVDPFGGCGEEGSQAHQPKPEALPLETLPSECKAGEESAEWTVVRWQNPSSGGASSLRPSGLH